MPSRYVPVSYTHLDVYKRQGQYAPDGGAHMRPVVEHRHDDGNTGRGHLDVPLADGADIATRILITLNHMTSRLSIERGIGFTDLPHGPVRHGKLVIGLSKARRCQIQRLLQCRAR